MILVLVRSIKFQGGESLTVHDILDAPGEVIGKSGYGTLYRANLLSADTVMLLRFLRPTCTDKLEQVVPLIQALGSIRHPNLVPLCAFYAGPRGEKLLVYPFYSTKNLAQFIRGNVNIVKLDIKKLLIFLVVLHSLLLHFFFNYQTGL